MSVKMIDAVYEGTVGGRSEWALRIPSKSWSSVVSDDRFEAVAFTTANYVGTDLVPMPDTLSA